jgi:integrase/recombinase XerD
MEELKQYRLAKGLSPLPQRGEETPLVLPIGNGEQPLTRAGLHLIVKSVFSQVAQRIRSKGIDYHPLADHVDNASAHWLRHTASSHMANSGMELVHVRDTLGHASISTTNIYLHGDDDRRHKETEEHHRIDW